MVIGGGDTAAANPEPAGQLGNQQHIRGWSPGRLEFQNRQFHADECGPRRYWTRITMRAALLTTGRTANYDGPQISINDKMYVGSEVQHQHVGACCTPADGSTHVINMSLQTTLDGNTSYPSVTAYPGVTVAADGKWHQISITGYTMSSAYSSGIGFLVSADRSGLGQRSGVILYCRLPAQLRCPTDHSVRYSFDLPDLSGLLPDWRGSRHHGSFRTTCTAAGQALRQHDLPEMT